jgi:hypothetical protein
VLGAISRGEERRSDRAAVRGVLRELIVASLEPIELLDELPAAKPLRLVIEP